MKKLAVILCLLSLKVFGRQAVCEPYPVKGSPDTQPPLERIVKEAHRPAIVRLREICSHGCSGVVIAKGYVLTAAHCMARSPFAFIRFEDNHAAPGIVKAIGSPALAATDWAILETDTGDIEPLKLACSEHYPQPGIDATCGGKDWPYQQEFPVTLTGIESEMPGVPGITCLGVHGPVDHGDSGSPVLDSNGDIVGLISRGSLGTDRYENQATPLSVLRMVLKPFVPQFCPVPR